MKGSGWELKNSALEIASSTFICGRLYFRSDNFLAHFPEDSDERLESNTWILQPFTYK